MSGNLKIGGVSVEFAIEDKTFQAKLNKLGGDMQKFTSTMKNNMGMNSFVKQLKEINNPADKTTKTIKALEDQLTRYQAQARKSGAPINKDKIEEAKKLIDQYKNKLIEAEKAQSNLNKKSTVFDALGKKIKGFALMAGGAIAAAFSIKALADFAKKSIQTASQFEQFTTQFEVMTGSAMEAAKIIERLEKQAAATPFEMSQLASGTQKLMAFGLQSDEAITSLMRLGDIAGGNAQKLETLTLSFGKMSAKGKADLEALNMMIEAGVPILDTLADGYKVSKDELFKMISAGKVSFKDINDSVIKMTSSGGQYFNMMAKQAETLQGLSSTLKDNWSLLGKDIFEGAVPYIKNFQKSLIGIIEKTRELFNTPQDYIEKGGLSTDLESLNIDSLMTTYDRLSKKINLTNDEKKQFKEIQDELILKMPDLKDIIDNETGALNTNSIAWKNKFTNAKIESAKAQKEMSDQLIKLSENYSQTISNNAKQILIDMIPFIEVVDEFKLSGKVLESISDSAVGNVNNLSKDQFNVYKDVIKDLSKVKDLESQIIILEKAKSDFSIMQESARGKELLSISNIKNAYSDQIAVLSKFKENQNDIVDSAAKTIIEMRKTKNINESDIRAMFTKVKHGNQLYVNATFRVKAMEEESKIQSEVLSKQKEQMAIEEARKQKAEADKKYWDKQKELQDALLKLQKGLNDELGKTNTFLDPIAQKMQEWKDAINKIVGNKNLSKANKSIINEINDAINEYEKILRELEKIDKFRQEYSGRQEKYDNLESASGENTSTKRDGKTAFSTAPFMKAWTDFWKDPNIKNEMINSIVSAVGQGVSDGYQLQSEDLQKQYENKIINAKNSGNDSEVSKLEKERDTKNEELQKESKMAEKGVSIVTTAITSFTTELSSSGNVWIALIKMFVSLFQFIIKDITKYSKTFGRMFAWIGIFFEFIGKFVGIIAELVTQLTGGGIILQLIFSLFEMLSPILEMFGYLVNIMLTPFQWLIDRISEFSKWIANTLRSFGVSVGMIEDVPMLNEKTATQTNDKTAHELLQEQLNIQESQLDKLKSLKSNIEKIYDIQKRLIEMELEKQKQDWDKEINIKLYSGLLSSMQTNGSTFGGFDFSLYQKLLNPDGSVNANLGAQLLKRLSTDQLDKGKIFDQNALAQLSSLIENLISNQEFDTSYAEEKVSLENDYVEAQNNLNGLMIEMGYTVEDLGSALYGLIDGVRKTSFKDFETKLNNSMNQVIVFQEKILTESGEWIDGVLLDASGKITGVLTGFQSGVGGIITGLDGKVKPANTSLGFFKEKTDGTLVPLGNLSTKSGEASNAIAGLDIAGFQTKLNDLKIPTFPAINPPDFSVLESNIRSLSSTIASTRQEIYDKSDEGKRAKAKTAWDTAYSQAKIYFNESVRQAMNSGKTPPAWINFGVNVPGFKTYTTMQETTFINENWQKFHDGGYVSNESYKPSKYQQAMNSLKSYELPAVLKNKEFVINDKAVESIGRGTLDFMNNTGKVPSGSSSYSFGDININANDMFQFAEQMQKAMKERGFKFMIERT